MYISDEQKKRAIVYARESYTEHGLGCAEAVIAALIRAGILDLDGSYVCFGSGFTGGVGCSGGTCGAIYGGEIALGAVYGRKNPRAQPFDRSKKENLEEDYRYYLLRRFNNLIHDFIQKFGSSNCTDLVETENGKLTKQSFDICTNRVQFMVEQTIKYLELNEEENKMLPYSGKALPTGNPSDIIRTSRGPIEVSLVDVANPCIFVHARDVGILGTKSPAEIDGNPELLKYLEEIRGISCIMLGMCDMLEEATKNCPAVPMVCVVSEAADYVNFTNGEIIRKEDIDFVGRLMFMQILHKAYAGTGTACTGAAAKIRGTVLNKIIPNIDEIDTVRIGLPSGIIPVVADVDGIQIKKAAYIRTARRIMEGYVYIEKRKLQ